MATGTPPATDRSLSPWSAVAKVVVLLTLIITVLLIAFAWPAARSEVHDVPIAVAGPDAAVEQVAAALDQRLPDGFEITRVGGTAEAGQLIRDRDVYGAIDVSAGAPRIVIASAASSTVAQILRGLATGLSQAQGGTGAVAVRDLVPLPADDPRGAGLSAGSLPLVMGGILAAVLLTRFVLGTGRRVAGAFAFAVTGSLAMAAALQLWFGSLEGHYLANAGAIALTIAASSLTILGLESLLGYPGLGLGAVVMMVIGNPLAGTASAPEMLPGWSGELGQLMPPGAGGQLTRSTAYFDGHGVAHPVVVLLCWLAVGLLLCLASAVRARRAEATEPARDTPAPCEDPA